MTKNYSTSILLSFVLTTFLFSGLSAQGEANNWYFGQNAGISFNTSPPTVLLDGALNTNEGCSSISSPSGDLLFYTDGRTIWNANHEIMPNADYFGGTGLNGDPSSTSSGLIVPHPTQDNLYYVFTVDEPHHDNAFAFPNQGPANPNGSPRPNYSDVTSHTVPQDDDGFNNGFAYTLVNMNLDNGLGDVVSTEKNVELQTFDPDDPEDIKYKCSEKITAVRAQDCSSIWVITHFKDTFYAFFIDENGVNQTPVSSQVGPLVATNDYRRAAIGYLKASPNGDKILTANQTMSYDPITQIDEETGNVYLFDFDNVTGQITNPLELTSGYSAYGVEFSPEGTKAYASVSESFSDSVSQASLFQWDLEADDIPASLYSYPNVSGNISGAIQLAPNGKIYRTIIGSSTLAVINNPELPGVQSDYSESISNGALNLEGRTVFFGLPPFIQSLFSTKIDIVGNDEQQLDLCEGDSYTLSYDSLDNVQYIWQRDGVLLVNETSSSITITSPTGVEFPHQESYSLEILFDDGTCPFIGIANVTYYPNPVFQSEFINNCSADLNQNTDIFDLTQANSQLIPESTSVNDYSFIYFESVEDAENNVNPIENPQAYTNISIPQTLGVIVENNLAGCSNIMNLTLDILGFEVENYTRKLCDDNQNGIQNFNLLDIAVEENITITDYYLSEDDALAEVNPISDPANFQNENPYQQNIFFRIDTNEECKDLGILSLQVIELPLAEDTTFYYCIEQFPLPITITADIPENQLSNYELLWLSSDETTPEIQVNESGNYELAITNIDTGCTNFKNVEVVESSLAEIDLEIEELTNDGNRVTVTVSNESLGNYEYSLNPDGPYQDSNVFDNLIPGIYDIYVRDKNGCGTSQKTFGVLGLMDFFTPNEDGINDVWTFKGIFNNREVLAKVLIFDRYGKLLKSFNGLSNSWDGTYKNRPMPSQDYWYKIQLESGRILSGNFTLKR